MNPAQVRKALLGEAATGVIPRDLLTTDRVLQRWSVGSGSGLPSDTWDDTPRSRPVSLDPDTWFVVDKEIRSVPRTTNRIVVGWYCTPAPTKVIAERLGFTRAQMYQALGITLNFMKYRFEGSKYAPLIKLLQLRIDV
ncbi:MAG: hypothetical protein ABI859_16895 [Pseudomonadota bacterium]